MAEWKADPGVNVAHSVTSNVTWSTGFDKMGMAEEHLLSYCTM